MTFKESGRTYFFPFRHSLRLVREFVEPLVRSEFAYVAENLLLRAGYRKTHFQADQTTLQNVSQMGEFVSASSAPLSLPEYTHFTPLFTPRQAEKRISFIFPFQEMLLQAALPQYLHESQKLAAVLQMIEMDGNLSSQLEVLGERALSHGHVDILIKDRVPIAVARKIVVEVKRRKAQSVDLVQLREYGDELGKECVGKVLVAESFPRPVLRDAPGMNIRLVRYALGSEWNTPKTFEEIQSTLKLELER